MTLASSILLGWSLANQWIISPLDFNLESFFYYWKLFIMKNLPNFCKMMETGVDPCLYLVVFIQDYTQKESCLLSPFGNPYFSLKWEFIGTFCMCSNEWSSVHNYWETVYHWVACGNRRFSLLIPTWGHSARRNVCDSETEIPYWWCKICPESSHKRWLHDRVVTLF